MEGEVTFYDSCEIFLTRPVLHILDKCIQCIKMVCPYTFQSFADRKLFNREPNRDENLQHFFASNFSNRSAFIWLRLEQSLLLQRTYRFSDGAATDTHL